MRRSPSPLRAISSPCAELGVDVGGRPKLRSAFVPHTIQGTEVLGYRFEHFGSTDAQDWSSPSPLAGDASRPGAAPQPFSEEEKI